MKAEIGQILKSSWGYEQTNVNFYQIVRATEKTVWLRPIKSNSKYDGRCRGKTLPVKDAFTGGEFRRKISTFQDEFCIKISSYEYARPWNGKEQYFSEYA